jgi:hypothetical protein
MKYFRKPNITFSTIDDEVVLIHPENGNYYSFNKVGSYIWICLEKPINIEQLEQSLMLKYDVSKEQCKKEVEEFLNQLIEKNLIDVLHD